MTRRSDVWKHFEKYGEEAKCLICKKNLSCKGSTGLRNHLLIHNIQLGLDHISDNEPLSKKHSTQSLLPSFSKKQSLDEVIARLAAEDGCSYIKISRSKFIRSSLKEKGFTPIQDHSTVSRMVLRYANHVKGVITSQLKFLLANGNGEIDEDVYIPPLKINIKTVIVKFRNIVHIFRKSPLKNEVLQSYIKEDLGKTLNLVMDCKTRWNSLINMISRLLTVRKLLCKAMIDINLKMEFCELDWQVLENICSCLKPIEMGISVLCQRDENLLSAEGVFDFMFQKLEMVGSDFALELLQNLRQRFNERRQSNLINVMKHLLNPDSIREDPCIKRKEVQKTMRIILSQLYSLHGTEQSDNVIVDYQEILEDIEDVEMHSSPILLTNQLKRAIQKSTTHVRTPKEDIGFLFFNKGDGLI